MKTSPSTNLRQTALDCVCDMGDIFWDYVAWRDAPLQYRDPFEVAVESVEKTLREVALDVQGANRADALLHAQYETLIAALPKTATDQQIIRTLVANADWTRKGASEVLHLAQRYGTSILRNALALAEAMEIEDGNAGL